MTVHEVSSRQFSDNLEREVDKVVAQHEVLRVRREGGDFVVVNADDWRAIEETLSVSSVGSKPMPRLSEKESELLLKINRGLSDEKAAQYRELMARRQAGSLSPAEQIRLLDLSDEVERLQAERIEHLADLARLRGKPLATLMEELGIRPSLNG